MRWTGGNLEYTHIKLETDFLVVFTAQMSESGGPFVYNWNRFSVHYMEYGCLTFQRALKYPDYKFSSI